MGADALEVSFFVQYSWRVSYCIFCAEMVRRRGIKEEAMRKILLLALLSMFITAAAFSKGEETAPSPEASASAEASPGAAASPAEASPAASPATP